MKRDLDFVSNLFSSMMTRPDMYAGDMRDKQNWITFEILIQQLLQFRQHFLEIKSETSLFHSVISKKFKTGSSAVFADRCTSEADFLQKMQSVIEEVVALQDAKAKESGVVFVENKEALFCEECSSLCSMYEQDLCCNCGNPWETEAIFDEDRPEKWKEVFVDMVIRKKS